MGSFRSFRKLYSPLHILALASVFLCIIYLSFTLSVQAAVGLNETINFQGKLVNSTGLNVADSTYTIVFSLYNAGVGGTQLWTESRSVGTTDGIFRIDLGGSTSLSSLDFNQDNLWLGIKVGADSEMTPRVRFTATPYAFQAKNMVWSGLQNPLANLALSMGSYTSTLTYGSSTGSSNLYNLTDTASNSGTGYLLNLTTASSSALKPFHVSAAGVEALIVDASGNVGVGTTSPKNKLSISGGVGIGTTAPGSLYTKTATAPHGGLIVEGNVGIGTTAPNAKLDVAGNIFPTTTDSYDLGSGTYEWQDLFLAGNLDLGTNTITDGTLTGNWGFSSGNLSSIGTISSGAITSTGSSSFASLATSGVLTLADGTAAAPGLAFTSDTNTGLYRIGTDKIGLITGGVATQGITIDASGNVGIGTTGPTALLHLGIGSTATVGQKITLASGATANAFEVNTSTGVGGDKFVILANGNVGIGTTSPANKLEVAGTGWLRGGTTTTGLFVDSSGNVGVGTTAPVGVFNIGVGATPAFVVTSAGNIGIGTTAPGGKLEVASGNVFFGDSANANMTQGLTINQGVNDNEIFALKSSDIAHMMTNVAEADTFAKFNKNSATLGGLDIFGLSDGDNTGVRIRAMIGSTAPTATMPAIILNGSKYDAGTSVAALGNAETLLQIQNNVTTRLTMLGDGSIGLGTVAPSGVLDLGSATGGRGIAWSGSSSANYANIWTTYGAGDMVLATGMKGDTTVDQYLSSASASQGRAAIRINAYTGTGGSLHFFTDADAAVTLGSAVTPTERMTIDYLGRVAIADISPDFRFEVVEADNTLFAPPVSFNRTASGGDYLGQLQLGTSGAGDLFFSTNSAGLSAITTWATWDLTDNRWEAPSTTTVGANQIIFGTSGAAGGIAFKTQTAVGVTVGDPITFNDTMMLTDEGLVGIGTVAPLSQLGVLGNASIGATYGAIAAPTSGLIVEGNVGIGTTSPGSKFEISDTARTVAVIKSSNATDTVFGLYNTATNGQNWQLRSNATSSLGNGNFSIYNGTNSTNVLNISPSGNVGIGSTSPSAKLTINGTTEQLRLSYDPSNYQAFTILPDGSMNIAQDGSAATLALTNGNVGIGTTGPLGKLTVQGAGTTTGFSLLTQDSNGAHKFAILDSGNVGIGNTSPKNKLDINGAVAIGSLPTLALPQSNSLYVSGNVGIGTTGPLASLTVQGAGTGTGISFLTQNSSGTRKFAVLDNGNVGIGTTSPAVLLDLGLAGTTAGSIRLAGSTSGNVSIGVTGAAGTWTLTLPTSGGSSGQQLQTDGAGFTTWAAAGSTREIKNVIGSVSPEEGLSKILGTQIYNFRYKPGMGTGDSETVYTGVMADESPWAMHHNGTIVNPVNTLGYMVLGIRAQQARFDTLQTFASSLETTVNKIHSQNLLTIDENGDIKLASDSTKKVDLLANSTVQTSIKDITSKVDELSLKLSAVQKTASEGASLTAKLDERVTALEKLFGGTNGIPSVLGVATESAQIARKISESEINIDKKIIAEDDLTVLGKTTLNDLGITGKITAGILSINGLDDENLATPSATIETISGPLRIQPIALQEVTFMKDRLKIDTNGNLNIIAGNINLTEGVIKANNQVRGIDLSVEKGADYRDVIFEKKRETDKYAVSVSPSWPTSYSVKAKTEAGFKIQFTTVASDEAKLDWIIIE